jgi:enoyl-CoA hydratase/carnithine racemase
VHSCTITASRNFFQYNSVGRAAIGEVQFWRGRGKNMGHVQTELKADVLRITLDRPEKKNALSNAMYAALAEAVEQAEANPDVRVMLLHGNGDSFTAGNDLEDFMANPWKGQTVPPALRFIAAVVGAKKPIIAAVHGMAVGIGVTILLHCDLVYAADTARLVMPFVNLGIVPEAGSTVLLPALMGHQRAAELLMLAAPVTAQRAYELGMVNAVVAPDALLPTAMEAAQKLAEKPAGALRATKALLRKACQAELERAIREEVQVIAGRLGSPETREALAAFLEKRKPNFTQFR